VDEFIKKVEDLYKRSINKSIITYTGFLTPAEKQLIIRNFGSAKMIFSGGVDMAERVRAFFLPDYMEVVTVEDYITAFRATFSFRELSHRDFLGAILALGIERRCLGDIYVFDKEAYFFMTTDIKNYVKSNLDKVANVGIKLDEVPFDKVKILEPSFEELNFTVASLRIDSIVSGAIKESREKTNVLIKNGNVLLNYLQCESPSKIINEGDVFSIKGYGKYCLMEVLGESRKGKKIVKVNKYV